ncbi:AtpZ/AtpI family protein [Rosettibacter firmus]|uniref:AtpZ/AtpI family protein n=1 Tax=Rosettibacter firmus TaxID=3111522 RepID=UPI00336C1150
MINFEKYPNKIAETYRNLGPYLGLGTQLAATIILMFFIGRWLDNIFNTSPILMLIFSFLGCFAAVYNFIKTVLKLNKK